MIEFFDKNGFRSSWEKQGMGKKILFLPGWAESGWAKSAVQWEKLYPSEFNKYEKFYMNLGGHYPSEFPSNRDHISYDEFLDSHFDAIHHIAENNKLTLIGHSTGAFVLWQYFNRFPEKVDKIVLVGSFLEGPLTGIASIIGIIKEWNLFFITEFGIAHSQNSESLFREIVFSVNPETRKDFLNRKDIAEVLPFFFEEYKRMSPKSLRIILEILVKTRLSNCNLRPRLKLNFIHGDKDPVVPYSIVKKFCSQYDSARLFTIPNSGHSPQWENQSLFWKIIHEILEE